MQIKDIGSKKVQAFPAFSNVEQLGDFLARAAWHFSHLPQIELFVSLAPGFPVPANLSIPEGFAPDVQIVLDEYLHKVQFQIDQTADKAAAQLNQADIVLKWVEDDSVVNYAITEAKRTTYRVDSSKVRQEGSFYIQCAFDLYPNKKDAISDSMRKFDALMSRIGKREKAWVMATGPSVESYAEYNYENAAVIICNSVVLNDELMTRCKPSVLVFADPIFHFGVSQYAGRFREVIAQRLATTNLSIVVPFKYYPLLLSKLPQYAERIIGVPFEKTSQFNFDIRQAFQVKTTANILTLLLLPLATTLARQVNLIGCDGRPLDRDDYFWGHGKSVQINDKMENIKRVHPGFFEIDYNEYYFEHCHSLENIINQGEHSGYRFVHHGFSHIPALRDRPSHSLKMSLTEAKSVAMLTKPISITDSCIILEPDGVGMAGHYVRWHRNLIESLHSSFNRISILCNIKQDPNLYSCVAYPTFTSFSWGISRADWCCKRDFFEHSSFKRFVEELLSGIRLSNASCSKNISVFVYYGSVQILKAMQMVRKSLLNEGVNLKVFVCLFHESVILEATRSHPRFPPNAAQILFESVAQIDDYKIASVTRRLADFVFDQYGVSTSVFPNPSPDKSDSVALEMLKNNLSGKTQSKNKSTFNILFPSNPRDEKGGEIVADLLSYFDKNGVPEGLRFYFRGTLPEKFENLRGVEFIADDVSDDIYWSNLVNADVVIIPYLSPCFTYRTSGILVDALVSGVPCVVLNNTWLADVVQSTRAGLIVKYYSPHTIISAIKIVLANREFFLRVLDVGGRRYLLENSWKKVAEFARV